LQQAWESKQAQHEALRIQSPPEVLIPFHSHSPHQLPQIPCSPPPPPPKKLSCGLFLLLWDDVHIPSSSSQLKKKKKT
jgi:hypothetical protein